MVALALMKHPGLWPTALRQLRRTAPDGWWRRRPFLPVPSGEYLRFRLVTQYGSADHPPEAADVLNYLTWCKGQQVRPGRDRRRFAAPPFRNPHRPRRATR